MALLDGTKLKVEGASTPIEPCDLLSEDGGFIHIKHRRGGSSSLSHLFAQARISCEAFVGDGQFRENLREHVHKRNPGLEDLIPLERPQTSEYRIVLGILGMSTDDLQAPRGLPFFSQLNLVHTTEFIRSRGFQVELLGVGVDDAAETTRSEERTVVVTS